MEIYGFMEREKVIPSKFFIISFLHTRVLMKGDKKNPGEKRARTS